MFNKWSRLSAVGMTIWCLAVLAGIGLFRLNSRFYNTCPQEPDAQSGHVFPLDNRGHFVYLTAAQNRWMTGTEALFGAASLPACLQSGFRAVCEGGSEGLRADPHLSSTST